MLKTAIVSGIHPATHYTRLLLRGIISCGSDVDLLSEKSPATEDFARELQTNRIVPLWNQNWSLIFKVPEYCKKNDIQVVHVQHEFNMYHRNYYIGALLFLLLLVRLRLNVSKVIVTIHAVIACNQMDAETLKVLGIEPPGFLRFMVAPAFSLFYRVIKLLSHLVVVHSEYSRDILMEDYNFKSDQIRVIPHGIVMASEKAGSNSHEDINQVLLEKIDHRRILFCFGYLIRRKGIEVLINAFADARNLVPNSLLVIGGGPLRNDLDYIEELKSLVLEKGLEKSVLFTGFLSESDLLSLTRLSEIVFVPNKISVASSGVLSIALGMGKPVITADHPTIREVINDGENALLFGHGDVNSLKDALVRLSNDQQLRQKLSAAALETAQTFSWKVIASRHCRELYDQN